MSWLGMCPKQRGCAFGWFLGTFQVNYNTPSWNPTINSDWARATGGSAPPPPGRAPALAAPSSTHCGNVTDANAAQEVQMLLSAPKGDGGCWAAAAAARLYRPL